MLSISTVSSETGIAKEVLRKWETRYGFPVPARDAGGKRVYTPEQLQRLKLIKKLMDDGLRAGEVVPLDDTRLTALAMRQSSAMAGAETRAARPLIAWLLARDPVRLRENLRAELVRLGLGAFVLELMPGMNHAVGEAWASGEIAVHDEHLYTEIVQNLVREALSHVLQPAGWPRVLLTTPPGELHTLGLLMLETVLSLKGAGCLSLGAQSPLPEIALAAQEYDAQIVGLSLSASFPKRKIFPLLKVLRASLPADIQIWAGGAGTAGMDKVPRGTAVLQTLEQAAEALDKYRQRHPLEQA